MASAEAAGMTAASQAPKMAVIFAAISVGTRYANCTSSRYDRRNKPVSQLQITFAIRAKPAIGLAVGVGAVVGAMGGDGCIGAGEADAAAGAAGRSCASFC